MLGNDPRPRQRLVPNSSRQRVSLSYAPLETRHLLAGIYFDSGTGELTVFGDGGDNVGQVAYVGTEVEASISDAASSRYPMSDVQKIIFVGFGGDDQFVNQTSIPSALYGHDGNDLLRGGSGDDILNGGRGDDDLAGRAGDDLLLGSFGNDRIRGNDGHDRIIGGSGENMLFGDNHHDVIFGGDDADTIWGGDGHDKIYALGGDDLIFSGAGGIPGTSNLDEMDLVLGLAGDDRIVGESGLDVFWGGSGQDTLIGGTGENRLHGQSGDDLLTGGEQADLLTGGPGFDELRGNGGDDFLAGNGGDDLLIGGDGADILRGQDGNDRLQGDDGRDFLEGGFGYDQLNGGGQNDVANHFGARTDFSYYGTSGFTGILDNRGFEGLDELTDIGWLKFSDETLETGGSSRERITIQPIIVSNDDGSNQAEYLGDASQQAAVHARVNQVFSQANLEVVWLAPNYWNDTFANVGDEPNRPERDLDLVVDEGDREGVGNSDPLVLDMYFMEVVPGFSDLGENYVNGLAYVSFNGIGMHVGDRMLSSEGRRNVVGNVIAHEIAHNLGLFHIDDFNNLMDQGDRLLSWQIETMIFSRYTIPI